MREIYSIIMGNEMPWYKTGANYYKDKLELPNKGPTIKWSI